mmetsp:Transcript_73485/g.157493  ORF Transcript_73485/g.157493 Transcript_73485/m.157493 type:complete len:220 (+) Transcript_73485:180-839(+)
MPDVQVPRAIGALAPQHIGKSPPAPCAAASSPPSSTPEAPFSAVFSPPEATSSPASCFFFSTWHTLRKKRLLSLSAINLASASSCFARRTMVRAMAVSSSSRRSAAATSKALLACSCFCSLAREVTSVNLTCFFSSVSSSACSSPQASSSLLRFSPGSPQPEMEVLLLSCALPVHSESCEEPWPIHHSCLRAASASSSSSVGFQPIAKPFVKDFGPQSP